MARRAVQFMMILSLVSLGWAVPAHADGGYPPEVVCIELQPTSGLPGISVEVSGGARTPGATLTVTFDDQVVGSTTVDGSGSFSTMITIPSGAVFGDHTITVSGSVPGCQSSATFTVLARAEGALAFTGAHNIFGLAEIAAGLAALGAVLTFGTRRRREMRSRS